MRVIAVAGLLCALSAPALAQPGCDGTERGTLSLVTENDLYAGTDRNYTNGLRLSYLSPRGGTPEWMSDLASVLFVEIDPGDCVLAGLALGHSIFTPEDISAAAAPPGQHPYAGLLYAEAALVVDRGFARDTATLTIGLVGPSAGAEFVQRNWHDLFDFEDPKGWDDQLHDEPVFALSYDRQWRRILDTRVAGLQLDASPTAGVTAGTLLSALRAGLTLRIGSELGADYGPPRIRPALAGGGFFEPSQTLSWYLFAGIEGRAVFNNVVLDGNTFRESAAVERNLFVGDAQAGLAVQYRGVQLAWTFVMRTEEFETQGAAQRFGALSLAVKF